MKERTKNVIEKLTNAVIFTAMAVAISSTSHNGEDIDSIRAYADTIIRKDFRNELELNENDLQKINKSIRALEKEACPDDKFRLESLKWIRYRYSCGF